MNKLGEISGIHFMLGNHAIVEGGIAAGCRYFAGYPITPASEIAERMSRRMPEVGGRFIQMEDEMGAIFSVIGASLAGAKAMTATASAGFNYMQEGIGLAATIEVPCVIVDVPRTRQDIQPTESDIMQVRWGASGDYEAICLVASSVQEAFDLTVEAFNFAEKYRNPVVLISEANISHMRGRVEIPERNKIKVVNRKSATGPPEEYLSFRAGENGVPAMSSFGEGYRVLYTHNPHDERGRILNVEADPYGYEKFYDRICGKITHDVDEIARFETRFLDDADLAVVSYGTESTSALGAVIRARSEGIRAGYVKLTTVWPVPERLLRGVAEKVEKIIVPEINMGKYVNEVKRVSCGEADVIPLSKNNGEIHSPEEILMRIGSESG